jgi:phosphoserine phosphatase
MNNTLSINPYISFIENSGLKNWDKIVFCDIEGTLFRDSLLLELYENIRTSRDWETFKEYSKLKTSWKDRKIKYSTYINKSLALFHDALIWSDYSYISQLSYPIVESAYKRVYMFTKTKLIELKKEWYKIIFISGSPHFMVNYFTNKYGFTLWLWTIYHVDEDNTFIDKREALALEAGKEKIINYIVDKYNPSDIIRFGDSHSDLTFLKKASKWYAINPTLELYEEIINDEKIDVVMERKEYVLLLNSETRKKLQYISWE